jgi:hypothetical protein
MVSAIGLTGDSLLYAVELSGITLKNTTRKLGKKEKVSREQRCL